MAEEERVPHPALDGDSRPFWEGLAQGKLRSQQCDSCHKFIFYPRSLCPHCGTDQIQWREAAGTGTIYSYTVVHQGFGPFAAQTPFVVALVDLDEGVRMMTRIIADTPTAVQIGQRVHIVYERVDGDLTLPYFALE